MVRTRDILSIKINVPHFIVFFNMQTQEFIYYKAYMKELSWVIFGNLSLMRVDAPQRPTFCSRAAGKEFPQDETTRVHVNAQERITTEVYCSFENLRSHVAAGSHLQQPMSELQLNYDIWKLWMVNMLPSTVRLNQSTISFKCRTMKLVTRHSSIGLHTFAIQSYTIMHNKVTFHKVLSIIKYNQI